MWPRFFSFTEKYICIKSSFIWYKSIFIVHKYIFSTKYIQNKYFIFLATIFFIHQILSQFQHFDPKAMGLWVSSLIYLTFAPFLVQHYHSHLISNNFMTWLIQGNMIYFFSIGVIIFSHIYNSWRVYKINKINHVFFYTNELFLLTRVFCWLILWRRSTKLAIFICNNLWKTLIIFFFVNLFIFFK